MRTGTPGNLLIVGGTAALPYLVAQAQSAIDVRLTIGDDVYCARLATFGANGNHRVVANDAVAPATCTARTVHCGDRTAEGSEECDDGNASPATAARRLPTRAGRRSLRGRAGVRRRRATTELVTDRLGRRSSRPRRRSIRSACSSSSRPASSA